MCRTVSPSDEGDRKVMSGLTHTQEFLVGGGNCSYVLWTHWMLRLRQLEMGKGT